MANPSLQIGNSNWAIKEDNLLGYSTAGTRFVPQPITMTRESAGTRVNSSGLVETVELLGSELVVNGDFSSDTDWIKAPSGVTISGGSVNFNSASDTYVYQDILTTTKTYKIIFSGTINSGSLYIGENGVATNTYTAGTYTNEVAYFTVASSSRFIIRKTGVGTLDATIDNVSVKESTKNNLARVDYDGTASSLLVEPQSTNLFINSVWDGGTDNVSAPTGWTLSDLTDPVYTYSTSQYPSGKKINIQCTGSRLILSQTVTIPSGSLVNISVKLKYIAGSTSIAKIASTLSAPADNIKTYYYNGILVAPSFTPTEDGILEMRVSSVTGGTVGIRLGLGTASSATGHIELDMPQCETLTYRTSFIPTTTSTVTRVKDQYSKTGISNLINSEEGVLFVEMAALVEVDANRRFITLNDGGASNNVVLRYEATGVITARYQVGGVAQCSIAFATTITNSHKIAFKYKENDFALWIDGTEVGTDTSGSVLAADTLNKISFDHGGGSFPLFGKVKQLQVFKTALTDTELATLTTI